MKEIYIFFHFISLIIFPTFTFDLDYLQQVKSKELAQVDNLFPLPFYYIEISRLLLWSWPREDIPNADAVETLLEDIQTVRLEKLRRGQDSVLAISRQRETPYVIDVTYASSMEVNSIRHTFCRALDRIVEAGEIYQASQALSASEDTFRMSSSYTGAVTKSTMDPASNNMASGTISSSTTTATTSRRGPLRLQRRNRPITAPSSTSVQEDGEEQADSAQVDGDEPTNIVSTGDGTQTPTTILPPDETTNDANEDDANDEPAPKQLRRFR
jgi:hypothetical protein